MCVCGESVSVRVRVGESSCCADRVVGFLQMRRSEKVLDTILADDEAISFLSSLLTSLQPQVQLAAVKLLAVLCSVDLAKDLAVRPKPHTCDE